MLDVLIWNKYARLVMNTARQLGTTPQEALNQLYNSRTFHALTEGPWPLITLGDRYLCDELCAEIAEKRKA